MSTLPLGKTPPQEHAGACRPLAAYRVAYILTPIEFGGSDKVNLSFLKTVDRTRFDIFPVLLVRPWEEENFFIKELRSNGYTVFKIPVARPSYIQGKKDYFRVLRCFKILYSYLKDGRFDLIHTHGYFADVIGVPAARLLRIPVISTCHGFIDNDSKLSIYNSLDRFFLRYAARAFAVSETIRGELIRSGVRGSRIEVIPNAVETNIEGIDLAGKRADRRKELGIGEEEFLVGYIGRLSEEKGLNFLVEAVSQIKDELPVRLLFIGTGAMKERLEKMAEEKGLVERVVFAGFQNAIEDWLPAMDLFALPSLTEGTPMALLEAMAFGVPTLATSVGGVPRVITDGENGVLVRPGEPMELAASMKRLFENEELRKTISENAQRLISEKYDLRSWSKMIEQEYESVLLGRRKGPEQG